VPPDSSPLVKREHCACPLCGTDAPVATPYAEDGFAVVRCGGCRLWYLSPRLPEAAMIEAYRSETYFGGEGPKDGMAVAVGYDDYYDQADSLRATFRRLVRQMDRQGLTGGEVLEIGCGHGFFLEMAAPYFDRRSGTEFSPPAAARARQFADHVWDGGIDAVPEGKRFDCIVAFHVIEHVYEPRDFMNKLMRHLKVGGHCVLAAPDMGSFWRRLMGARWPLFKYPEHVTFYDSATLSRLMEEAGLGGLRAVPYPHAFPLSLICRKLHLPVLPGLGDINIWLPGTTVAAAGTRMEETRP